MQRISIPTLASKIMAQKDHGETANMRWLKAGFTEPQSHLQPTEDLYHFEAVEDGLHWWLYRVKRYTCDLENPHNDHYSIIAYHETTPTGVKTYSIGMLPAPQKFQVKTIECTACSRTVKQGFTVYNQVEDSYELLSGKCLKAASLGNLTSGLFKALDVERYAYWRFIHRIEKTAEEALPTDWVLAVGKPLVDEFGYEPVAKNPNTRDLILKILHGTSQEAEFLRKEANYAMGSSYRKEILTLLEPKVKIHSDWALNVTTCLRSEWVLVRHTGIAASGLCLLAPRKSKDTEPQDAAS